MIIQCINCNKKFEVNSSLIPDSGRDIQCGSCNYTWFYKYDKETSLGDYDDNKDDNTKELEIIEKKEIKENNDLIIKKNHLSERKDDIKIPKNNSSFNLSLKFFFSCIIVFIITSITIIIILDTFKSPLSNKFPGLELLLYNLFETIKDISLFTKNLLL
tara:strand:+ start:92 stop:568 length:477 start_codon:yes stop_codon:yes gene_type:complete